MIVARFITTEDRSKQSLPITWTYPNCDEFEGAQVLRTDKALCMAETGEDNQDDWFRPENYSHIALIEVSGCSGESGPLNYRAVTAKDVDAMHVIDLSDSCFGWAMTEIALEMSDEGYNVDVDHMGMPAERWWTEEQDEVISRLIERCETVEAKWVSRVPQQ